MDKVIEITCNASQGFHCWSCHGALGAREMFCHTCGTIQPARTMDCFQRLGLERRIDVDQALLDRNFTQLQRSFAPERFIIRSQQERVYAAKHLEAVQEAYETLRDPVKRSRAWIDMNKASFERALASQQSSAIVEELKAMYQNSDETAHLDRVAQRAGQEIEFGIIRLLSSLRLQDWQMANSILGELDGLETLIVEVREKRIALTPPVER